MIFMYIIFKISQLFKTLKYLLRQPLGVFFMKTPFKDFLEAKKIYFKTNLPIALFRAI